MKIKTENEINKNDFYTVKDIQDIMQIGEATAYKLINSNGFPAIRFSSRIVRIPKKSFEKWVETYVGKKYML